MPDPDQLPGSRTGAAGPRPDVAHWHRLVALGQGCYYLGTGIWPLLDMRSFERVTGPKTDRWLVRTVGALVAGIGAGLLLAGARRRVTPELRAIGVLSAAALAAVETPTALRGRISRIYLLDTAAETLLVLGWLAPGGTRE